MDKYLSINQDDHGSLVTGHWSLTTEIKKNARQELQVINPLNIDTMNNRIMNINGV